MSRVQLALNVTDIDAAVEFYSKLFGAEPAKRRPGYANFAIAEPALKLVLIENASTARFWCGWGIEPPGRRSGDPRRGPGRHPAPDRRRPRPGCPGVDDLLLRRAGQGVGERPDGAPWEVYTVLADAPAETGLAGDGTCCAGAEASELVSIGAKTPSACC